MLVLAGGFGTRLKSVISDIPKPMAPVAGRPFMAYLLDHWITQGIQRFVISTGYLAEVIESYFGREYRGAAIIYVHEDSPLGTGGALCLALHSIKWTNELILMANGDTWFPVQLEQLYKDAARQDTPITLALKKLEKNDRYGSVKLDHDGRVSEFGKNNVHSSYINAGNYLINVTTIKKAFANQPPFFSLEKDFLPQLVSGGMVGASIQDQPFLDIGIPIDYQRVSEYLSKN